MVHFLVTGTVTDIAPSPSSVSEVLKSPSIHDLQVYGLIFTAVLCVVVFGGVKIINRVGPTFLVPVVLSIFFIFIGIFTAGRFDDSGTTTHLFLWLLSKDLLRNQCILEAPFFIVFTEYSCWEDSYDAFNCKY